MSQTSKLAVVILAAGQGTRMKSRRAKVLHELCGRPLLGWILGAAEALEPERLLVVVGRDADQVREAFAGRAEFVLQEEQRGTGHALLQTESKLRDFPGDVLVLYGDTPLLQTETLRHMQALKAQRDADLVLLTARGPIPGRVVRGKQGQVERIVEASDATPAELAIEERNTGVYLLGSELLWEGLGQIDDSNEQGELYLTDVVGYAVEQGRHVEAFELPDADECLGINDREELAGATAVMRRRIAARHMAQGVTIVDPEHTHIDAEVRIGQDSLIEPGCVIQGETTLGCGVHLKPHCTVEWSHLGDDVVAGPSAHLRPGTRLGAGVRVGNFVEIKNSEIGAGTKADHLSYIGDADVGEGVTFGCGSVVVNYDGVAKHRTRVDDRAFVGCNANLIAPVHVEADTFVAAGSTIPDHVPRDALAVARARQRNVEGWVARREGREAPRVAPKKARVALRKKKAARTKKKPAARKPAGRKAAGKKTSNKVRSKKVTAKSAAPKPARKRVSAGSGGRKKSRARR